MKNISTQKERIIEYLEFKGISKNKFYIATGISNGTLDKKSGLTGDSIEKFYSIYNDVNPEWLLIGKGEMLKSEKVYTIQQDKTDAVAEPAEEYVHRENPDLSSLENASKNELIAMIKELIGVNNRNSISIEKMVETADRNSVTLSRLVDVLYGDGLKGGNQDISINVG